jgi:hypothetical protein
MAKASKVSALLDVAAGVTLRDAADGAETASATETGVLLNELTTAYWHNNEIPHGEFEVVVHVSALNLSTNTYVIAIQIDDTVDMSNAPVTVASFSVAATGAYKFVLDSKTLEALNTDPDKYIAADLVVAGTPDSPSITYGAWIAKNVA